MIGSPTAVTALFHDVLNLLLPDAAHLGQFDCSQQGSSRTRFAIYLDSPILQT